MKNFSSVLIINPFGIGDVLFSTCLIRNLLEFYPDIKVYYLCNPKVNNFLSTQPYIHKTFVYDRDEWVALQKKSLGLWWKKFSGFIWDIRREHIELCIDLSLNTQYGFYAWCAGIPLRIGLDYKKRCFFLQRKFLIEGYNDKHVVEYHLEVLRKFLSIQPKQFNFFLFATKKGRENIERILQQKLVSSLYSLNISIAPCGGEAHGKFGWMKRWSPEKYRELIHWLQENTKANIFIIGSPKEKEEIENIIAPLVNKKRIYVFTEQSLEEIIALIEKVDLFIGNDSGLLHIADALNKKIVTFFGPVDEKVYGIYPPDEKRAIILTSKVSCRPCYKHFRLPQCNNEKRCLSSITVEQAQDAVKKLLEIK